ncbi:MAG: putative alpha/beta-hydrolase family hydrolase [Planctomycetota bacterium]|jgi:predicted alpha/beta-hydrolase family hydrolase
MLQESFQIPVEGMAVDSVGAIFSPAAHADPTAAILLAHGAGAPMDSEFMEVIAASLANEGFDVLRFQYAYAERSRIEGRRFPPDRQPKLESVHQSALDSLRLRTSAKSIVLAGKSMGGRMSSLLVAGGLECDGLIFLGYPLHPQGKPEKLRTAHFPEIHTPSLFLQGTRDGLCNLELLRKALPSYGAAIDLVVIEGGDHSFKVLKRLGIAQSEVHARLVHEMSTWIRANATTTSNE